MARQNYSYGKRQRELAKKQKREEKMQRKRERKLGGTGDATEPLLDENGEPIENADDAGEDDGTEDGAAEGADATDEQPAG